MTSDKRDDRRSDILQDDHDRMKLIFNVEKFYEEHDPEDIPDLVKDKKYIEFPAKYIVCYVCEGRGSYVNPSVDEYGIDPRDMDEDFAESYFEGTFDVTCQYCNGKRVVLVIDCNLQCNKDRPSIHYRFRDQPMLSSGEVAALLPSRLLDPDIDQQLLEFITKKQEEQNIAEREYRALVRSEQLAGC